MGEEDYRDFLRNVGDGIQNEPSASIAFNAIREIQKPYKSSFHELLAYRRNVPILIQYIADLHKSFVAYKYLSEYQAKPPTRKNQKWTDKEDNWLIEQICKDNDIKTISSVLHRTPNAIQTRISYLVGVKRLSQNIEGKFVGVADGEEVEQELVGTLYRK